MPSSQNGLLRCLAMLAIVLGCSVPADSQDTPATGKGPAVKKAAPKAVAGLDAPENPFPRRFEAPALDGGKDWLNTARPIELKDLRGKIVLLDFWTYCCINCMHVLPDLSYLEQKYAKEIVVIGVHSAKFDNEKDSDNIREAILRYEIEHPVVNDANMTIWRKFNVHSWPTLVVIDPEGHYCGFVSGEGNRDVLETVIDKLIAYHSAKGTLETAPIEFKLEREAAPRTPLRYPGKILADEASNRLFISDSNNNRIVITDLNGQLLETIGSGAIGAKDGSYAEAEFDHPQGMDLHEETLYIADTENHLLRAVDLKAKTVRTIAGTGKQAQQRGPGGPALSTPIASPWDVKLHDGKLYICMAGPHQIWVLDATGKNIRPYAGSGREDIINGTLSASALAQPSGMASDGKFLYVVDSEGSAVRSIPLNPQGKVTTIAGTSELPQGQSLFAFGDRDGIGSDARLQHPLGIAYRDGQLYVADTYNHKIKLIDIKKSSVKTFLGSGQRGHGEEADQFSEPAGLTFVGNQLYVADTNNHRIRVIDLETKAVKTLAITGLEPPPLDVEPSDTGAPQAKTLEKVTVKPATPLDVEIALTFPEGFKLNPAAPVTYRWASAAEQTLVAADELNARQEAEVLEDRKTVRVKLPVTGQTGAATFKLSLSWSFCNEGKNAECRLKSQSWEVPVEIAADGAGQLKIAVE